MVHCDCVDVMRRMDAASVDFILTDTPYLHRYRSRDGKTIANDDLLLIVVGITSILIREVRLRNRLQKELTELASTDGLNRPCQPPHIRPRA